MDEHAKALTMPPGLTIDERLARLTESDSGFAKIITAWPTLPVPIRGAMPAMIE